MTRSKRLAWLLGLPHNQRKAALQSLSEAEREELATHWRLWARAQQIAPGGDWRLWLIMTGRGFGKTRAGEEWVRRAVGPSSNPRSGG